MNLKHLIPMLMLGAAVTASADGYKDGIEYYKAGQYDNAREILERTINDASTNKALAYYYLGTTALAQKDQAAASAAFQNGITADPNCAYNYVGQGALALLNGNAKQAEDLFKEAQKLDKKNNEITVDIARAYYNANPTTYAKEVDKYLAKAHKDSKNNEPSIYILEGDMEYDNKELGNAAAKYEQAITFDVNNPEGYVKYAHAYKGVNPIYSVQKLEELIAKQPTSALAQRELAEAYFDTNQWVKAADQYGKYIQNPNHFPEDRERYAVLLYAVGIGLDDAESKQQFQTSLNVANELLAKDPSNFVMNRIKFLDLQKLGQNQQAVDEAQKFFKLKETDKFKFQPNDYLTLAAAYEGLGQDSLALIQYETAVAVDPARADNIKNLSAAYLKAEKYMEAAETFDKYIAAAGEEASLTDYLQSSGRWLNAAGRAATKEEAMKAGAKGVEAINKVIEGASEPQPEYYDRLGTLTYKAEGDVISDNVFNAYSKVLELLDANPANKDPQNPQNKLPLYSKAYLFLGSYYGDKGMDDERAEMYAKQDEVKALMGN